MYEWFDSEVILMGFVANNNRMDEVIGHVDTIIFAINNLHLKDSS